MTYKIVTTSDGTLSCHDLETGEWMHNRAGAYTEALKNYAEPSAALDLIRNTGQLRLLDACYGLGYNTWVLVDYLLKRVERPFTIQAVAIEKCPEVLRISPQIFDHPYFDLLRSKIAHHEHNIYYRTLECDPDTMEGVPYFTFREDLKNGCRMELTIWLDDLRQRIPKLTEPVDLVFHDAFSAQKMPELWTVDLFRHYHRLLQPRQGTLLTYSAAAAVRGGLQEAGFQVGKTMSVGAKSGGTQAGFKPPDIHLPPEEAAFLGTRAAIPYRDEQLSATREDILARRQQEQATSNKPSANHLRKKYTNLLHVSSVKSPGLFSYIRKETI
jgi:predicted methyltransferase